MRPDSSDIQPEQALLAQGRVPITTFGVRIGVVVDAPELRVGAARRLPPGWEETDWRDLDREVRLERAPAGDGTKDMRYRVLVNGEEDFTSTPAAAALDHFENVIQYYVSEFADPWLFVHAGVVAWRGAAIVLPGRSFTGKSTLVHALVDAGATYFSDEYAVFDAEGRVWPYLRRLALREGPFGPARRVNHTAIRQLEPLPVGIIALLTYDAEAGWDVTEITPARAVLGLCDNTVAIQRRPKDALEFLSRAAEDSRSIMGTRGDAEHTALTLLRT